MTETVINKPASFMVYDHEGLREMHEFSFEHTIPAEGLECPEEGTILVNLFMKAMDYRRENFGHMRSLTFSRQKFNDDSGVEHIKYRAEIIT